MRKEIQIAQSLFIIGVSVVLFLTAGLKVSTLISDRDVMRGSDPLIFFLSNNQLVSAIAVVEIGIAVFLLCKAMAKSKLVAIAWLSSLFLGYRIGLFLLGYKGACYCMGMAESWLTLIKPLHVETLMRCLLGVMLIGSFTFLLLQKRLDRKARNLCFKMT